MAAAASSFSDLMAFPENETEPTPAARDFYSYGGSDPTSPTLVYKPKVPVSHVEDAVDEFDKGMLTLRRENYGKAMEYFKETVKLDPSCVDGTYFIGDSLMLQGKPEHAIPWFDKTIQLDPQHCIAYYQKGMALCEIQNKKEQTGEYTDVQRLVQQRMQHGGNLPHGQTFTIRQDAPLVQSLQYFKKAAEVNPNFSHAIYETGSITFLMGDATEGEKWFDKTIAVDPAFSKAWDKKGDIRMYNGNLSEALRFYEEAIKANPWHPSPLSSKGMVLYNLHRYDEALETFDKCLIVGVPVELEETVYSYRAISLVLIGRVAEADKALDEAIKRNPRDSTLYSYKGIALFKLGKIDKARKWINRALELGPASQEALIIKMFMDNHMSRAGSSSGTGANVGSSAPSRPNRKSKRR